MPVRINWGKKVEAKKDLYFQHLEVGDTFKINNSMSKGVVYMKVECQEHFTHHMLELATGKVYPPTPSKVERVGVEINIEALKPSCY
jgi:hypothetical protein